MPRTCTIHMSLYIRNKVPDFETSFRVLEAERVVDAVRFGPNDECFYYYMRRVGAFV
jgi:hypothetical protein